MHIEQARNYFALEQYDRAAEVLSGAAEADSRDRRVQELLGEVRASQGLLQSARESFQRAGLLWRAKELDERAAIARVTFEQGRTAERAGRTEEAIRLYEKSRRIDAQPETLSGLAKLLQTTADEQLRDAWYAEELQRWSDALAKDRPAGKP